MKRFILLLLPCCSFFAHAGELVLVADGQPRLPIVIPSPAAKKNGVPDFSGAATDLRGLIRKASGALPDVVTIDDWKGRPAIFLGCAPTGVELPPIASEEDSRTQSNERGLFFTVKSTASAEQQENALRFAVNRFAERVLGCRWLMPGELGEVIPQRRTIAVTDLHLEEKPLFWSRRMRDRQTEGHASRLDRVRESLETGDGKDDQDQPPAAGMGAADWLARMNVGRRFPFEFGHSFAGWWDKYGQQHPEYFALQPDGTRTQHPPRERLCESQPKLWDEIAAHAIAAFAADPGLRMFSICENDGGQNRFCMCPSCMALDFPGAIRVKDSKLYDPKTGEPFPNGYPSLSDRVFTFFNEIARRVKAKYPDRYLGTYAYSVYRTVPIQVSKLEDNLIVSLVSDNAIEVEQWSQLAPKMFVRPNTFWDGRTFGIARNDARRLGRLVQTAASHHVLGFDWDGMIGNWATQGLNYYVTAKLMWDPSQDLEALITDYLDTAYGHPAAPAMRRYYDELEQLTLEVMNDPDYQGRKQSPEPLLTHYTPERLASLEKSLTEARQATAADSPERRRVELVQQGLEYTRHVCSMIAALSKTEKSTYDTVWKKEAPYFARLVKSRYFGAAQNLTKIAPALKSLDRRDR